MMQGYRRLLSTLLSYPGITLVGVLGVVVIVYVAYGKFNYGIEFFPSVEPDSAQVQVRARGDLSVLERDAIVQQVEGRLQGMPEVKALYARSMLSTSTQLAPDVIGVLQFQFTDWFTRRPASAILEDFLARTEDIPGIELEFRKQETARPAASP